MNPMNDLSPEWLDEDRRQADVYANDPHHLCVCDWRAEHKMWKLVKRNPECVLHGIEGHI